MAVIVLTGMPATGKSTICKALAEHFCFPVVEKDAIKEEDRVKKFVVTGIGDGAFANNSSISKITFAAKSEYADYDFEETPYHIGDGAFRDCAALLSLEGLQNVTTIGAHAFRGCAKLTDITIGAGVKTIGKFALKECSSLNGVTFKKTSGWKVNGLAVPSSEINTKSNALKALAFVYAASEWRA